MSPVRAPATRDQADAYRFGLRRMEAALVRGDPVPLHEQIRTQRRAALAGVVLGLLGLCGALVWAKLSPSPNWSKEAVVVGATSGAMYAVAHDPDRLVPVADLPAARLVLAALRSGAAAAGSPGTATATVVPDDSIATAPRTPAAAVAGAVAVTPETTVPASWAVCDTVDAQGALLRTTVVGGAAERPQAPQADGVLMAGPDDTTWLVTDGLRYRLDAADGAVRAAFGLAGRLPRAGTAALISTVPEGPPLATPVVPGRGEPAPNGLPGQVGDVLSGGVGDGQRYYVVLRGGLQELPAVAAELLVVASDAGRARGVGVDVIGAAAIVHTLPLDGWPPGAVRVVEPDEAPVTCWTWQWAPDRPTGGVWFGRSVPLAPKVVPVTLAQADGPGGRVDAVAVGAGGAVRATGPGRAAGAGPLWLVSAAGVGFGVADEPTATALGITAAAPAPEAALRLLPVGTTLDVADASRLVDGTAAG